MINVLVKWPTNTEQILQSDWPAQIPTQFMADSPDASRSKSWGGREVFQHWLSIQC